MMEQVLTNTSKVIVDQKNGSNLLYLPLDKLIHMSGPSSSSGTVPETQPASPPEPAADAATRTREAFRGRERETR
jgi:membrane protease subunit HflK